MRIASLVPSATEILFALGLDQQIVAVTHECDYPARARTLPHLTRSVIAPDLDSAAIDAEVKRLTSEGQALYELDTELLARLEVDLIVTQEVCRVCAVSYDDVRTIAAQLPRRPEVLSLDPSTLDEVLGDVELAADAAGQPALGVELRANLQNRLDAVAEAVAGTQPLDVVALEWLSPPFTGGHWLPEMIELAGGRELLGRAGAKSAETEWEAVQTCGAERVIVMPCGWDLERSQRETSEHADQLSRIGAGQIHVVDAAASFSRPGPRLVDGTELLAHLLHPDRCPDPGTIPFAQLSR